MTNRSGMSMVSTPAWLLLFVILDAVRNPGWVGQVGLVSVGLVGAGVLWNLDAIAAAWREDREAKRNR